MDRSLSNKEVFDWFNKVNGLKIDDILENFSKEFQVDIISCSAIVLYNKVTRLTRRVRLLKKGKKKVELEVFLGEQFLLPRNETPVERSVNSMQTEKEKKFVMQLSEVKRENKSLKRKLSVANENENRLQLIEEQYIEALDGMRHLEIETRNVVKKNSNDLNLARKELEMLQVRYEMQSEALEKAERKVQKSHASNAKIRRLNKKICYRDSKLEAQKEEIGKLKKDLKDTEDEKSSLSKSLENLSIRSKALEDNLKHLDESILHPLKAEKLACKKQVFYLKNKIKNMKSVSLRDQYTNEVDALERKIENLSKENLELQQLVNLVEDDEIVTFQDGRYTNELREVIMDLLSMNVSMSKVNDVIKTVITKLAKKSVDRLPSNGVKSRLLQEALIIAQTQVVNEMLANTSGNNCLHGDGTSKYHKHYQNFQVTTASGKTLSFGLAEISGGDAAATLQCFTEAVDDLCDAISSKDKERDFAKLVGSIKTTMSDLGPVNPVFNSQLKQLREELLPKAIDRWNELNPQQKSELIEMANYYCKLHLLANFATETDKVLKDFENMLLTEDHESVFAFHTKESCAVRLVRTACKAFQVRGSDEAGVASYFDSFLSGRNEKSFLVPFIGNRFNILYYNAAALYYHSNAIKDFFKHWPDPNNLIKAVNEDITNDLFLAEVRALGIVDKLITGPLWRLIESSNNILHLNPFLFRLQVKLSTLCNDASSIMHGETVFSEEDVEHHKDIVWSKLFEETTEEFDVMTQQALEVIIHSILIILERQCADQLPGGKYWHPSDRIGCYSANVPSTNKASESDFAILDLLIRVKPSASIQSIQALTMWARNGTSQWLDNLPEQEREELLNNARVNVMKMKDKYVTRKVQLLESKKQRLLKKQEMKKEAEARANAKKVSAVNRLQELGVRVWISLEEVENSIWKIEESHRVDVVLSQIEFYRYVIQIKCPQNFFTKTKVVANKRVSKSLEELLQNLRCIIQINMLPDTRTLTKPSLRPYDERDEAARANKKKLMEKIKNGRLSRICNQQKSDMLSSFLSNPDLLVGKVIQHRVVEENESESYWSRAVVLSVAKKCNNAIRTEFSIRYNDEPDAVWQFPLLLDMEKGDLLVL